MNNLILLNYRSIRTVSTSKPSVPISDSIKPMATDIIDPKIKKGDKYFTIA